jgi:hypothetical protein
MIFVLLWVYTNKGSRVSDVKIETIDQRLISLK